MRNSLQVLLSRKLEGKMVRLHIFLALAAFVAVEAATVPRLSGVRPKIDTLPDSLPWKASLKAKNYLTEKNSGSRIVGGQYAQEGQFPYQAALFIDNQEFCGGSIISSNWILTAGHCGSGAYSFVIILGSLSIQQGDPSQVVMQSNQGYTHPYFSMQTLQYDVSLIRVPQQIPMSPTISPISLSSSIVGAGQMAVVSGWGKTSDSGSISQTLKYTNLQTIDNNDCAQYYGGFLYDGNICCSSSEGTTCQGDSGGPLVIGGSQIGIVSFGGQSCLSTPPAFTRISYVMDWISQTANN
ncbi:brachyurin-like [Ischnura elegans]|uniref:brachyurin-like n=1 Tax=Ischnura elegans TaxID=197161 RepID=UPI001ED885D6|nr:brachyurin-like [Ischnura elegans]